MNQNVRKLILGCATIGAMTALAATAAFAQSDRMLTLVAGAMQYDLRGTGTTAFAGLRLDIPAARFVIVEPGVTFSRYNIGVPEERVSLIIPEIQAQLQARIARVRPFVGFGAGVAFVSEAESSRSDVVLSLGLGSRFDLTQFWGGRAELRLRSIDPWIGSTADWTIGISRRF